MSTFIVLSKFKIKFYVYKKISLSNILYTKQLTSS